jgi:hypothetical protein
VRHLQVAVKVDSKQLIHHGLIPQIHGCANVGDKVL